MATRYTDAFRRDAVRKALTSGLTCKHVSDDLGVGMSTLNKWITAHRDTDVVSNDDLGLAQENDRLRRENRILKEESEILEKTTVLFASQKSWAPSLSKSTNLHTLLVGCAMSWTSATRGLRAFRSRPASRRQLSDLVTLAHIKEQPCLSLGSYGRPRMIEELKEIGLSVGHRRVGRLMRQNGISVVRTRKHKVTNDSNHKFNIAPNLLDRNFAVDGSNHKWAGDITYIWTREGWLYLAVILDLLSRRVIGWAVSNRMKRDLAIRALKMPIAFRSPPKGCIPQTDRGSQYFSHDFQKILRQHGFKASISGNCYDNAAV